MAGPYYTVLCPDQPPPNELQMDIHNLASHPPYQVPCPACNRKPHVWDAYHCPHCLLWFCRKCYLLHTQPRKDLPK